jgi:hypothetical protein
MLFRSGDGSQKSGSIGGVTFSHNAFGAYTRARTKPVNPNTSAQNAIRAAMRTLTTAWQGLSSANKAQWAAYAAAIPWTNKVGDTVKLTPLDMYVRSNSARLYNAVTRVDTGPATLTLPDTPAGVVPTGTASTQHISIAFDNTAAWAAEAGGYMFIQLGGPKSPGVTFFNGPFRSIGKVAGSATPPTSPVVLTVTGFGFQATQALWLRVRAARADGRLSAPLLIPFLSA